jgi:cytochrome c oxidase subunit 1
VHNTIWIVGHFHITVGGPVALTFLGAAYWLIPKITGRRLWAPKLALAQVQWWFIGMVVMSISMHYAGLLGAPRRTAEVAYQGAQIAQSWQPYMLLAAGGGVILTISIIMFVIVAIGTLVTNEKTEDMHAEFAQSVEGAELSPMIFEQLPRWGLVAIVLALLAYAGPLNEMLHNPGYLAPGMRTW